MLNTLTKKIKIAGCEVFTICSLLIVMLSEVEMSHAQEAAAAPVVRTPRIEIGIRVNQMTNIKAEFINRTISSYPDDIYKAKFNYFSSDLFGQYANAKNMILKFKGGLTLIKLTTGDSYSNGNNTYNFEYKQSIYSFAPGIGQQIVNNKLTFKAGVELPTQIFGTGNGFSESIYIDSFSGNKIIRESTTKVSGGFAVGFGFFGGASFSIIKNLAVGVEVSYGFKYGKIKSKTSHTEEEYDSNGNLISFSSDPDDEIKLSGFGFSPASASLALAVKF